MENGGIAPRAEPGGRGPVASSPGTGPCLLQAVTHGSARHPVTDRASPATGCPPAVSAFTFDTVRPGMKCSHSPHVPHEPIPGEPRYDGADELGHGVSPRGAQDPAKSAPASDDRTRTTEPPVGDLPGGRVFDHRPRTYGVGAAAQMFEKTDCRFDTTFGSDSNPSSQIRGLKSQTCQALLSAVSTITRLDDFVCEKIGSGFFSEVYKVQHKTTGRVMALKMNVQKGNRFNMLVEVQLLNRLWHPNVLRYFGACVHEGQLHALTEYINGGNLEQLLASNARLPWSWRVKLALDLACGLKYLHSRGVFHRDLTSKNCLVREDSHGLTAVIGDFGLAGRIPDPDDTQMLTVVGSPFWMAPEVLRGEFYNQKVDVFSYGIILCEIIARVQADPDYLPRTKDFGLDHEAFRHMVGDCPEGFLQLAFSCCNVQHSCRPLVSEVVQELEALLQQLQQEEAESQPVPEYLELQGTSTLIDGPLTCSQSDISCPTPPTSSRTPKLNPFSARKELNGGHTKLYDTQTRPSLPPLAIAMPLSPFPTPPSTPQPYRSPEEPPARRCRSLPTSPLLTHHCQRTSPMSRHYPHALADIPSPDLGYGTGSPFDDRNNLKMDPMKMKAFVGFGVSRLPPNTASPAVVYYPSESSSGGYLSSHSDEQSPVGSRSEWGAPRRPHCQKAVSGPWHHKNELPAEVDTSHPPNLVEGDHCLSLPNQASLSSVSKLNSISSSDTSCGQDDVTAAVRL